MGNDDTIEIKITSHMLSNESLRETLKSIYRPERFEDRDTSGDNLWNDYSASVIDSRRNDLNSVGSTFISRHDTQTRKTTKISLVSGE